MLISDGVAFDLDGTLLDSERYHRIAYLAAIQRSIPWAAREFDKLAWQGRDTRDVVTELVGLKSVELSELVIDYVTQFKKDTYRGLVNDGYIRLFPWAVGAIDLLVRSGVRVAVVTGTDTATATKVLRKVARSLDMVVASDTLPGKLPPKPSPEQFNYLFQHWQQVNVKKIMVVEDSVVGMQAAVSAGAAAVVHVDLFEEWYRCESLL